MNAITFESTANIRQVRKSRVPGLGPQSRRFLPLCAIFGTLKLIDRSRKLPAFFYESALGNRPVREWILGLSLEDRKLVGRGKIGRVIFCVTRERMVLLHRFLKKTQKTPAQDLRLALKRMEEVL